MRVFRNKKLIHHAFGQATEVQLWVATYPNGRVALQLMAQMEDYDSLEPYLTPSVNLVNDPCPNGEIYIKNWSENEGIQEWLIENGVIEPTPTHAAHSGYVMAERFKLTPAFSAEVMRALTSTHRTLSRKERGVATAEIVGVLLSIVVTLAMIWVVVDTLHGFSQLRQDTRHIRLVLDEATCHTDEECIRACEALKRLDCDDEEGVE